MPKTRIRRYLRHGMLPQLAVFEAVSRLGSYTRAAEELFLAQPTVSTQMKKLADTLGVRLIEQNGKRLQLTEAGYVLADACKDIFQRFDEIEDRLAALRSLDRGRLRVAVSTAGKYFMPRLLGRFCEHHPSIEVSLHIDNWRGMRTRIRQGEDDLYVLSTLPSEQELVAYPILPHPIELYARRDHRLCGKRGIAPAELRNEPFLLREPGSATRRIAEALCEQWGIVARVRMELGSNEAIKQALMDGLGIALLSRHLVDTQADGLCALEVAGLPVVQQWSIAHARGKPLSPVAAAFLDYVRAHVHEIAAVAMPPGMAPPPPEVRRALG